MNFPVIECVDVAKEYQQGEHRLEILKNVHLSINAGHSLAIIGASGSGKSTLLNLLGGLDRPTSGLIRVMGNNIHTLDDRQLSSWRNSHLGFVYQMHHLLMEFTAQENVAMPLLIRSLSYRQAMGEAAKILDRVGLSHRLGHKPHALSGGERQRVAIARALVTKPSCILMDEPTGNLDAHTAKSILALIQELQRESALSFIVVTHDLVMARSIGQVMVLDNGILVAQG